MLFQSSDTAPILLWRRARGLVLNGWGKVASSMCLKNQSCVRRKRRTNRNRTRVKTGPDNRLIRVIFLNFLLIPSRIFKRISRYSRLIGYAAERKSFIWVLNVNGSSSTLFAPVISKTLVMLASVLLMRDTKSASRL